MSRDTYETVTIFEDWVEIGGAIWWKWRLEGEDEWHWEKTPYKDKPVIYMKTIPQKEFDLFYKDRLKEKGFDK